MMYPFPFFRPPFSSLRYGRFTQNFNYENEQHHTSVENDSFDKSKCKPEEKEKSESSDSPVFDILGIKLYNDDLLILGLLFFLYSEGVQDHELFLSLLLLLLS